jgi:YVTN family beta-propeller protein
MSIKSLAAVLVLAIACFVLPLPFPAQSVIASIPVNGSPEGVAVDPVSNRVYAAIFPTSVAVIDGATNSLLETVSLPFGAFRVAVDSSRKRVYIAGCDFSQVPLICGLSVLDESTNTVVGSTQISANGGIGVEGLAVNPETNRIYVSDADNFEVDVIDAESVTIIANISFGRQEPLGLAIDPHPDRVFATINGDQVGVINVDSNRIIKRILVGQENANTAVNPATHRGYVTNENFAPSTLGVIDTRDFQFITNIPVGNTPFDVAVDASSDLVFVTNIGDSTISIVNGANNKNVGTIQVFGRFIATNPITHRVYASDDQTGTVHVISEH